jgi:hypothetical protein
VKKQHLFFLLAFLLPTLIVLWWWGLFRTATIDVAERGPYRYVYVDMQGPYSKLAAKQQEVYAELRRQNITAGSSFTIIYDNPRTTKASERHARTGYLIDPSASPKAPLQADTLPLRRVVMAQIKAHPLIAYGKVYTLLENYAKRQAEDLHMPTVEIYSASVLTVEMPLEKKP